MEYLTKQELQAIANSEFFFTKASATEKIQKLLAGLQFKLQELVLNNFTVFPEKVLKSQYKISKGENYKGLPYLVLDYPAWYTKSDIFAFRALLWWGNHFSFSLHLQGESLELYKGRIIKNLEHLHGSGLFFCVNQSPWEYHFNQDNFISIKEKKEEELISLINSSSFLKLAAKYDLENLEQLPDKCVKDFIVFINLIR
jgi:hypothetical protein